MILKKISIAEETIFQIAREIKNKFRLKGLIIKTINENEFCLLYPAEIPLEKIEELKTFLKVTFPSYKFNFQKYQRTIV